MSLLKPITQYFKQSLIDSERLCPDDKDLLPILGEGKTNKKSNDYVALDHQCWLEGRVELELAQQLIQSKQIPNRKPLTEIEVLLFPRVDMYRIEGANEENYKRRVLLPLVVFARLQANGNLLPTEKGPWIPRNWLSPNESRDEPIGDFSRVDDFLTLNPFEGVTLWPQLVEYCTRLLAYTVGEEDNLNPDSSSDESVASLSLFDLNIHPEYVVASQCLIQVETPILGVKAKLVKVLKSIEDDQPSIPLYERYCSMESPALRDNVDLQHEIPDMLSHVGQMSGEFPLSPKQRNSLHHFHHQQNGEILAINGPPGTGKTTLLRSVVANLWTQAAIDETEPPLIVATSNNNQAVTNILESFAKVDEEGLEPSLKGRWLPEISSYGLYCCAKSKANSDNKYLYHSADGAGRMQAWQTKEYIDEARSYFLEKINCWTKDTVEYIDDAKSVLHKAIVDNTKLIKQGCDTLKSYQKNNSKLHASYTSIAQLQSELSNSTGQLKTLVEQRQECKGKLDKLYALWEQRGLSVKLLWWIPFIRKAELRKTSRLLRQWDISIKTHDDDSVEQYFHNKEKELTVEIDTQQKQHDTMSALFNAHQKSELKIREWIDTNKTGSLFSSSYVENVHEVCDRTLRFRIFKLATHYWEARWLLETKEFVSNNDADKKSPVKVLRKLRRYAKLTPCFVSTLYMVPAIFSAGKFTDSVWKDFPLLNEIDLLIVDESGQASPEVAAVSFALAKKALVVGDTDQIEPVWAVPSSVDRSNLRLFGLLNDKLDYDDYWLSSGLLASSGNVMSIAQRQSNYHQFSQLQRGLYLTEHRRCYDEIINYCNDLVYQGVLEPLRQGPKQPVPWGCMSFIAVEGVSNSTGGSRSNISEAKFIANWLSEEQEHISEYIDKVDPKLNGLSNAEKLQKSVGIITPFKKQANLIRKELKKVGIKGLTVGTVHSLQGDERLIVLFSAVYGSNDKASGKFYDRGSNMLNVAVSRAKDSFIVFGQDDVFGAGSSSSPSVKLRNTLTTLTKKEA